ncbi:MAG TPA: SpoIIE family protein phosphatase [Actinophytocola sp.]|uniref:SpoIIE family protein phosphatase n=1 Tax=Actinophytocola sp. TaxID=1872138 RepID=UPI002DDC9ACE|nr:SpoIIE family protein phosphatase [Actinophytocola sp.]HEV2784117.1 SpoIIE family protein phosphatase [Actinophytocola sp.]
MDQPRERRARLPADAGSPAAARRLVRSVLTEAGLDDLADDALLLTSELCENAVLHAGTGFELQVTVADGGLTVAVTDQGSIAMELRRAAPSDRRDTHNRGLQLVDALSTAWGSRHDHQGHQVWFTLRPHGSPAPAPATATSSPTPATVAWPGADTCRWMLHIPTRTTAALPLPALITELIRRLCDVLGADGGSVWLDHGDGEREVINYGRPPGPTAVSVPLPVAAPRMGQLHLNTPTVAAHSPETIDLVAQRIALAVETDRIRRADHERWTWMTYLAEASDLLIQSLDLQLTTAIVPQIIVPRLGRWCAVHLLDEHGEPRLHAVTHVDETALPGLKAHLDRAHLTEPRATWREVLASEADTAQLGPPTPGIAVPLRVRRMSLGTLSVGRPADRPHSADEVLMITELARRAAHAIDNAQRNAATFATSQALQQALLPRALPSAAGMCFAAAYQPAGAGADVGGDFYDVVMIDENRWLATVGDVCGRGPRAAAMTGMVRDVLRVLVRTGHTVVRAVELLNETIRLEADSPRQYATVAVALISRHPADPPALAVELVLAGHEQPALLRADGTVTHLGRHGTALGLLDSFAVHPTRHILNPGDTLVFYTDGITERRHGTEQFGPHRLARALAAAGGTADEVLAAVQRAVRDFSPEPQQDDIAILVMRIHEPDQP